MSRQLQQKQFHTTWTRASQNQTNPTHAQNLFIQTHAINTEWFNADTNEASNVSCCCLSTSFVLGKSHIVLRAADWVRAIIILYQQQVLKTATIFIPLPEAWKSPIKLLSCHLLRMWDIIFASISRTIPVEINLAKMSCIGCTKNLIRIWFIGIPNPIVDPILLFLLIFLCSKDRKSPACWHEIKRIMKRRRKNVLFNSSILVIIFISFRSDNKSTEEKKPYQI